jgi:RimJ/RimL family protein N-acetyltransferase
MPRPKIAAQGGKMILETPCLILRPFAADDLDRMAELMANKDFMRFSMADDARANEEFPR